MKKRFSMKWTTLFLCFAILFPLCAIGSLGLELPEPKERPVIPYALRDCEETETFLKRLPGEEQGLDTIVFLAEGGQRAMYLFTEPVKYLDENGETVDKDLTLVKTDGGYTAKANDIALLLPDTLSDGISLSYEKHGFALRPTEGGEESVAELTKENTVLYAGAFGAETALRYTPAFSGFKEDILLYQNVGKSSFSFTLSSDTLVPFTDEAGVLFFCDRETGEPLFRADDILCHDANDYCFTGALIAEPTEDETVFLLTVSVDPAILDDPDLVYPVTIDPTISLYASASGKRLYDATICTNSAYCSGTGSILTTNTYSPNRFILFSFPVLYNAMSFMNSAGFTITNASLYMKCSGKSTNFTGITAHLYAGPVWNESNVPTSTSYYSSPYASAYISSAGSEITLNVTALFQSSNMDVRKGILIKPSAISSGYASFYSTESTSNRPYFNLTYTAPALSESDFPSGTHSYVLRNCYSNNFAYISGSYAYLKQADPDTVKEGGKDFDSVLFTIQYDDTFKHYCISNYKTQNYLAFTESYPNDAMDPFAEERGWYILKNDGYYQFVLCSSILSPTMMKSGTNTGDGAYVQMGAYDASSSMGKWSLFLAVNAKNYIQQPGKCSAASVLQALYGCNAASSVPGSTDSAKESNIYNYIGAPYDETVRNALNNYLGSYIYKRMYYFEDNDDFCSQIFYSLCDGYAAIAHPYNNTAALPYYNAVTSIQFNHYICIAGIDI